MNPVRSLVSLKKAPAYKPLPRRQIEVAQAPWMPTTTTTTSSTAATTTSLTNNVVSTTTPSQPTVNNPNTTKLPNIQPQEQLTVVSYDDLDRVDLDCDEFIDPFASDKNKDKSRGHLIGDYDEDDEDEEDGDDDDDEDDEEELDDEEAEIRAALREIQEERQREQQLLIKSEMGGVKNEGDEINADKRLFTNPLLATKMTTLIKTEQSIKNEMNNGGIKNEFGTTVVDINANAIGGPVKRKKWTSDSIFTNTALSLGDDTDPSKRQRLNNDTINSDKHRDFMKSIFK